jgi:large subunit ribosomal protein L23
MNRPRQIIKRPIITEKSTVDRETYNIVTFAVDARAGKLQIKQAVEELFDVQVLDVRTSRVRGKRKRLGRHPGVRPSWKKARVKLASGESIEFFEGV